MKEEMKTLLVAVFVLLLIPSAFAAIGDSGNYNSWTKLSFLGFNSTGSNYQSRGSGDQITGSFSISSYSGRFGILKYCGNSIIESGETCDSNNLNSQTCGTRGYSGGTLACKADCSGFDVSRCTTTPAPAVTPEPSEQKSFSGEANPRTSKSSVAISEGEIEIGTVQLLAINRDYSVDLKGVEHRIDVKQVTADYAVIWIYSEEPIEVFLGVGERKRIDLDDDGSGDIFVELRGIRKVVVNNVVTYEAFIFFKKMSPITGQAFGEEDIELPAKEDAVLENILGYEGKLLRPVEETVANFWPWIKSTVSVRVSEFSKTVRYYVDGLIYNAKTKKSWLLPSLAFISLLILFFVRSFSFYLQKKRLKGL